MIAETMTPAEAYFPDLERLGLRYVEKKEFEGGVQTSIFEAENGKIFLCPGVWGLPEEDPMLPARKIPEVLAAAREFLRREGLLPEEDCA